MDLINPYRQRAKIVREALRQNQRARVDSGGWARYRKAQRVKAALRLHYSYGIPTTRAVETLVDLSPLVEIGAGLGYWAWMIGQAGGDVRCFDQFGDPSSNEGVGRQRSYVTVENGGPKAAGRHPERTLFLCWPDDYGQSAGWSDEALCRYLRAGGERLALVAEDAIGAAGSDQLFELIDERMKMVEVVKIDTYPRLHDRLRVYEVSSEPISG